MAHALLIGVGNYDPRRFADLPGNVRTITGPEATAAGIRAALQSLAQSTNSGSTAFIYFSGHGGRALESGQCCTYLCPREADPEDLPNTAISGKEFSAALAAIPARKLLVMLNACHAGGSAELKATDGTLIWESGLPEDYYEALSQGSGRVVIASSKENQFSYVRPEGDLSLLSPARCSQWQGRRVRRRADPRARCLPLRQRGGTGR